MEKNIDVGKSNNFILKSINILDDGKVFIHGVASTSRLDYQGEIIKVEGIDFQPFLRDGYLNWHHNAKKTAGAIVGKPTEAYVEDGKLHVKGQLYKTDEAMKIYQLMMELEREGDTNRQMKFSIEGAPIEHEDEAKTIISKMIMTGLALTLSPANDDTWAKICKSFDEKNLIIKTNTDSMAKKQAKESPFTTEEELLNSFRRENGIPVPESTIMKSADGDADDEEEMKKSEDEPEETEEVKKGAGDDEHEAPVGNEIHLDISKEILKALTTITKSLNMNVEKAESDGANMYKAIDELKKSVDEIKKAVCKADSGAESEEEGSASSKPIGGVEKSVKVVAKPVEKTDELAEIMKGLQSELAAIKKSVENAPKSVISKAVPHPSERVEKTKEKVLKISDLFDKEVIMDFISKSIDNPELRELSMLSVVRGQDLRGDVKGAIEDRFGVKVTV
jgi:hypothetical protein